MKVYVLEQGEYEQRGIWGVYSSLEKAMGVRPGDGDWTLLDDWDTGTDTWVPGSTHWARDDYEITVYDLDS